MIERLQGRAPVCVAALAGCMALAAPASAQRTAESIWSGGPSLTMNDKAMRAEAVTVANGRVLAVGRRSDEMKLRGPATQLVDLEGRTLVPGFVDAHGHVVIGGLQALSADLGPWHWSLTKGRGGLVFTEQQILLSKRGQGPRHLFRLTESLRRIIIGHDSLVRVR